ncbi:endonuclease/exonuclease/phosphatase family protein [Actinomadura kijaniata]|uniref:endonuclease/exonuclease/phosphatase family protein n=1 Tax=Actinomadura kijaniata TaxID=46161 RepID=UPI003F1D6E5C
MRAPRALIPLLAVAGAAAVVATAGASSAIDGLPSFGPAHADQSRETSPVSIATVTWNVCGDAGPGCPLGPRPADLVRRLTAQAQGTVVGGRRVQTDALLLQEVCSGHVTALEKTAALKGWSWAFAAHTQNGKPRACANGQGRFGVALGVRGAVGDVRRTDLPSPPVHGRVALCGTVDAWQTRLCTAQLSSADDPAGEWRRKQTARLAELAAGARTILAGDFVDGPLAKPLDPLYRSYAECDQGPEKRGGGRTAQDGAGNAIEKTDYLFTAKSASISCAVPTRAEPASDHRPVSAVVRFG